ncbi:hypothetical protein IWX90DRAFT_506174 [Phyllosticta citrichinensis]|uniref:Uncharacterized protein n=1 Tax=Phyllosticta citrichinensis TaxID=1130410 RepID=A0ABR1XMR5_9PEZI
MLRFPHRIASHRISSLPIPSSHLHLPCHSILVFHCLAPSLPTGWLRLSVMASTIARHPSNAACPYSSSSATESRLKLALCCVLFHMASLPDLHIECGHGNKSRQGWLHILCRLVWTTPKDARIRRLSSQGRSSKHSQRLRSADSQHFFGPIVLCGSAVETADAPPAHCFFAWASLRFRFSPPPFCPRFFVCHGLPCPALPCPAMHAFPVPDQRTNVARRLCCWLRRFGGIGDGGASSRPPVPRVPSPTLDPRQTAALKHLHSSLLNRPKFRIASHGT